MAEIELSGINKKYGSKEVLQNLTLTVHDGECFTLLGPSGCGKTVFLRLIAGFEKPDTGRIRIGDTVVADDNGMVPPDQRGLGVVFQDYAVWPHKSVYDNIAYPLQLARVPAQELHRRVMEVVELVNLTNLDQRMPSQLSGGQQQRVALARALVAKPALLLLDEPLCNLDANLREEMRFEIKELQKNLGITILYVTHDQEIALAISDRVAIMDEAGHIRQIGSPQDIFENPADEFVFRFMGVTNMLEATQQGTVLRANDGTELPWSPPQGTQACEHWRVGFRPSDVQVLPQGQGLPAVVRRASFLGAMTELRIDFAGQEVRTQVETLHAILSKNVFQAGDACGLHFDNMHWFAAAPTDAAASSPSTPAANVATAKEDA